MMFAALYLPDFELQAALRHEPERHQEPVVLLDNEEAKATILQLTKSAAEAGVSVGMTAEPGSCALPEFGHQAARLRPGKNRR